MEQTIAGLRKKNKDYEAEIENNNITTVKLKGDIAKLETSIGSLENEKTSLSSKLIEMQEKLGSHASGDQSEDVAKLRLHIDELERDNHTLRSRIEQLEGEHESVNSGKASDADQQDPSLQSELARLQADNVSLRNTIDQLEHEKTALASSIHEMQAHEQVGKGEDDSGMQLELERLRNQNRDLQLRIESLKTELVDTDRSYTGMLVSSPMQEDEDESDIQQDDLKVIEGVGPKTATLLYEKGITSWRKMADSSVDDLRNVLASGGERYRLLNPSTWPKQAALADTGEWQKLKEYQDYLIGGVEPEQRRSKVASTNFDAVLAKKIMGKKILLDDLTIVEGIGPKISELLTNAGYGTWQTLSKATMAQLKDVLNQAGPRYQMHNPGTWPKQAELAHLGKWEELMEYQEYLDGGKEPD